jgi:TolA-binding protein
MEAAKTFVAFVIAVLLIWFSLQDEIQWWLSPDSEQAYHHYMTRFPRSRHAPKAIAMLDDIRWQEALARDDIAAHEAYLAEYPRGRHAAEANERLHNQIWEATVSSGTAEAYEMYLKRYPAGHHACTAYLGHT